MTEPNQPDPQVFSLGYFEVRSIILGRNGLVYIFPTREESPNMILLNITTGNINYFSDGIYSGSSAFISPDRNYIYMLSEPGDYQNMTRYHIQNDQTLRKEYGPMFLHHQERDGWNGWLSESGNYIFFMSGTVYTSHNLSFVGRIKRNDFHDYFYDYYHDNSQFVSYVSRDTDSIVVLMLDKPYFSFYR